MKFVQYVEHLENNKKFQKVVVKRLSLWYLNESGKNKYFMRRPRGKRPFVEKCL